jgi:hypothetical protein
VSLFIDNILKDLEVFGEFIEGYTSLILTNHAYCNAWCLLPIIVTPQASKTEGVTTMKDYWCIITLIIMVATDIASIKMLRVHRYSNVCYFNFNNFRACLLKCFFTDLAAL